MNENARKKKKKMNLESGNNNGSICFNVPVNRDPSFHPF